MSQSIQSFSSSVCQLNSTAVDNSQTGTVPAWMHLMTLPISSHITIGFAKIFNFEVLTHGTSLRNYMSILTHGADPSKGGSDRGSTKFYTRGGESGGANNAFRERTKNHFYVFKDSEMKQEKFTLHSGTRLNERDELVPYKEYRDEQGNVRAQQEYRPLSLLERIEIFLAPRFHAAFSAIGSLSDDEENSVISTVQQIFYGIVNFVFSPTLRFIYTLEDTQRLFQDDPDYAGKAYRTPHALSSDRIGLIGVCQQASVQGIVDGMSTRPLRVLSGVVHLVAGTVFTATGLGFFI